MAKVIPISRHENYRYHGSYFLDVDCTDSIEEMNSVMPNDIIQRYAEQTGDVLLMDSKQLAAFLANGDWRVEQ